MIGARLEIYGIVAAVLLMAIAGAYFKGRLDEKAAITEKTLADNSKAMQAAETAAEARASADDQARQKAVAFMNQVDEGLANVRTKFSNLPAVVVDARGCERLTPDAGLRWNAAELLSEGPAVDAAGHAPPAVPASPVPAP